MARDTVSLDALRREIDRIDDSIHDLLMQRTALVEQIGAAKGPETGIFLRPGREAEILRRLVARHKGRFPKLSLLRIWRELMGALVGLQGPFSAAVYQPERGSGYLEITRDQFGSFVTAQPFRSVGQVVRAVADGAATVGIVPVPDQENSEPWWTSLMGDSADLPRVVSRLPFAGAAASRGENQEALVLARLTQDATGFDRTLLGLETDPDVSRARLKTALGASGLETAAVIATQTGEGRWLHLVELSGYVAADDRRIYRLVEKGEPVMRVVNLGGYAVPFTAEELAD